MSLQQEMVYRAGRWILPRMLGDLKVEVHGLRNFPPRPPALVISNHRTMLDPLVLLMKVDKPITFMAADYLFKFPLVREVFQAAGVVPVHPEGGAGVKGSIERAIELLQAGDYVGIYPEGADNFARPLGEEKVGPFHTGFARIAHATRVPVVPVAVRPERESLMAQVPPGLTQWFTRSPKYQEGVALIQYHGRVDIRIGKPLPLKKYYERELDGNMLHEMANLARTCVHDMYRGRNLKKWMGANSG
ncbi:MAG: 1-acyl-sn-glycerol-3-phosphate acyltransferase [Euryarchaeota archaeon]|nr:1-acyl-sn-glycerol-3-phosphate acyltransferase [Euryarchaeota archaeon]